MKLRQTTILLIVILAFVLITKLVLLQGLTTPAYDAYYGIRQIDHITQTGTAIINDPLSYQGRTNTFDFTFYYFLALFSYIVPSIFLFIYGGVLIHLLTIVLVFLVAKKLYKHRWIAVLVSLLAALNASLFTSSYATLNSSSLFLLLYVGLLYAFVSIHKNNSYLVLFLVLAIIGTLISSLVLVLVFGFLLYLLLLRLEQVSFRDKELEVLGFTGVFIIWYHLIVYKKLFAVYGVQALWLSVPRELLTSIFQRLSLPVAIAIIGVIPFFLGLYAIYLALFVKRNRYVLLLSSFALLFSFCFILGLIPLEQGLVFTTTTLLILSGFSLKQINIFFAKTKYSFIKPTAIILLLFVIIINFVPLLFTSPAQETPPVKEVELLQSLDLPIDSTIIGHVREGHLLAQTTQRKTFYDENFLLAPQVQQRYEDSKTIFLTKSKTTLLEVLEENNIDYIYLSDLTRNEHGLSSYLFQNDSCFALTAQTATAELYDVRCKLSK